MGLKCRISYRDGEAVVRDENGNLSDLYYNLLDYTKNSSDALDMWATAHSREFGEVGEAATVEDLVRYFDSSVASKESLSPSEKMQVKDFMRRNGIENLDQLNRTLAAAFKPNGIFEINPQAAVDSGLYSQDELRTLDPLTLQSLLLKIEGHLVNDNFSVEPEAQRDFYKDSSAKTILGTYERVTQDEVDNAILLKVTDFNNIEDFYNKIKELPYEDFVTRFLEDNDFANTIINRFKGLKRIPKLSFVNGELTSDNNKVYTTVKNTLPANQDTTKIEAEIDYLNSIDEDIWQSNPELIRSVLKEVENEFTNFNVDVIGISEFPGMRAEVMAVIESANEMLNQPTEANVRTFSDSLMAIMPVEDTVVVENIPNKYTAYNIVSLHTEVPENELFNSHGLIKVGDNLFHKVNQDANVMDLIDYLYDEIAKGRMSIPSEYMLTKDINNKPSVLNDISRYLMSRPTIQGLGNKELYSAYQVLFDHDALPSKLNEAKDLAVIKTDENYLKTSFVSDFYNYILREKAANTSTYKTILSKFEITDRDITLTDAIPSIQGIELQAQLEDYIRLQKDSNMKYLVPPTNEIVSEDLYYTNFPEAKSEYEGDFVMLGDFVITPKTSDNFIKINGDLYRVGLDREAGKLFVKVPKRGDSKYYTKNLNFEFDRNLASKVFDRYSAPATNTSDYTTFKSVVARSRVNDEMSVNLKEFSTLKDKNYTFFEVNNSIVAYKDGVRVGSIRLTKTEDGFADEQISVAEIHRGKGIATELYLRLFDKVQKEDKVFYPATVRTQAAQSIFSRLEGLLVPTTAGGFKVAEREQGPRFQISAWHGSPYRFERFKTEKIGTGEGAQAFGWGLYFTDLESIARTYAEKLTKRDIKDMYNSGEDMKAKAYDALEAVDFLGFEDEWAAASSFYSQSKERIMVDYDLTEAEYDRINNAFLEGRRNLYRVTLQNKKTPDQYTWLEWDKPVPYEQRNKILQSFVKEKNISNDKLNKLIEGGLNDISVDDAMDLSDEIGVKISDAFYIRSLLGERATGQMIYRDLSSLLNRSDKDTSLFLLKNGIDGIKYPSESVSRGATSDTARGFNYVVFDENAVEIEQAIAFSQASDSIKEAQIVPREAFTAILIRLTNTGLLKGRTFVEKADFSKGLRAANTENRSNATPDQIAGFLLGDDLYINPDMLNYNTPIHEYGHLWAKWARDTRPDLYKRGTDLVKDSEYYNDILERSKDRNSVYFNYSEDKILEEALVTAIGNQGESFINKTKYSNFKQFLIDLWTSIKNAVGLTQMDPNQVSNLTLDQFAYAVAIDLLRDEEFSTTTYTVPALLDQMLANKEGKLVNIQTIKQVLNQASTKKIEKDIINEVLELEYFKGKDKIPFDDFKAEVNARMMPLKVIVSSTYASYGSGNVDTGATKYETHIFNTDLDHQATGHFRPDFEASEGINFEIRETGGAFFVVEQDAVLTNENINEKVYNAASSRERAQAWIDNYDNARSINKGLFGHSRMWYNNEEGIAYGAEFQSDSYQKAKATDLLLASYNSDSSRLTEAQKPIFAKIQENKQIIDKAKKNQGEYKNVKELSEEISETMAYIARTEASIEKQKKDFVDLYGDRDKSPESHYNRFMSSMESSAQTRRVKLTKQKLEQLMNIAKGQEVTLPEMVSWTNDDPGSFTNQIGAIQLPFNEIDVIEKDTRSYKIKLGNEEATRYVNRTGAAFELKKDRKPSSTISRITKAFDYIVEEIEGTFRAVFTGDFRAEDYPTLNELFKKTKGGIKISELIDVLEKELPIVRKLGPREAFKKREDLGLELTLLKDKGRTSENLRELERQINTLKDAQAEVRNNRDFDRLENEIKSLNEKYWGEGILNEEDQAKYNSINEELKELNAEYSKYYSADIFKIAGSSLVNDLPLDAEIKFEVEPLRSYRLKTASVEFYSIEEAFDRYKEETLEEVKVDPKAYANFFNASREVTKLEDKLLDAASLRDKQFIAHRKNYTERLLREEIRRSAELGMKELRIPTPRTLALIEGYIESRGNAPYEIVMGNENYLEPGDQIEYAGTTYYVTYSDSSTIEVANSDNVYWVDPYDLRGEDIYNQVQESKSEIERIIDYEEVYTIDKLESIGDYRYSVLPNLDLKKFRYSRYEIVQVDDNTWRVIDTELLGQPGETVGELDSETAANEFVGTLETKSYYFTEDVLEYELEDYFESTTSTGQQFLEDFGYTVYGWNNGNALASFDSFSTETFNQPDGYFSSENLEDFDIDDMSSEQQTVLRKYEELNELFKTNRPDATIVTDNAGNEWIATQLTVEDGTKPVVTFMEVSPSKSVENIATIFDSRLELLDLYSTKEEAEILKDINDCGA